MNSETRYFRATGKVYLDRDDVIAWLNTYRDEDKELDELIEQLRCAGHNREVAEEALTQQAENLKDWEPVVHCKDCTYYRLGLNGKSDNWCGRTGFVQLDEDFCSHGKLKEPR